MIKKIFKALTANLGYKLLSVLIAVVIWYVVVDFNDPVETATYSIKITVANESYISSGKQSYRIDDQYKSVTVYIKGNRSTLKKISSDDITVTADLTQIVDLERDPVMVPLTATCTGINATNITLSRTTIPITIENIASKEFAVSVDVGDTTPGTNYEVGVTTPDPEQIVISGPESVVNEIESVVAQIDVTGMTQDGTRQADLILYDTNMNAISEDTIEDDLTIDSGVSNVTVYVDLWKKQSGVELDIEYSGTPASGYNVTATTTTPETITVVGTEAALETLAEDNNVLTIDASDEISVANATDNVSASVNLADKLPSGLRLANTMADTVTVNITVLSDETKEIDLDVDDIKISNLGDDLAVSYDQTTLTVRITGLGTTIDSVTASDITATIDLKNMTEGDYSVPVTVTLPTGVTLDQSVTITVHLKSTVVETTEETEDTET